MTMVMMTGEDGGEQTSEANQIQSSSSSSSHQNLQTKGVD